MGLNNQLLFIAVSVIKKEFVIINFSLQLSAKFKPSHSLYGGKLACKISIKPEMMNKYTSKVLISEIGPALGIKNENKCYLFICRIIR